MAVLTMEVAVVASEDAVVAVEVAVAVAVASTTVADVEVVAEVSAVVEVAVEAVASKARRSPSKGTTCGFLSPRGET